MQTHGFYQSSCVDTPQQNKVFERKNRNYLDVARSLLFTMNIPKSHWGDVIRTTTYLINKMPSRVLNFQTSIQTFLNFFPNSHLLHEIPLFKVFGCSCFVHIHSHNRGKLEPLVVKCIFLGYSPNQNGYKSYSSITKKITCPWMLHFLSPHHSTRIHRFRETPPTMNHYIGNPPHHTLNQSLSQLAPQAVSNLSKL